MVEAKTAVIRQENQFVDTLMATQTAKLINVQCGTKEDPNPASPEMCMAFDWSDKTAQQPEPEPEGMTDEQIQKSINTMKNWVATTGGKHG